MSQVLVVIIRAYQFFISPILHTAMGPTAGCRFEISCSEYAIHALTERGVIHGSVQSMQRILRCI